MVGSTHNSISRFEKGERKIYGPKEIVSFFDEEKLIMKKEWNGKARPAEQASPFLSTSKKKRKSGLDHYPFLTSFGTESKNDERV